MVQWVGAIEIDNGLLPSGGGAPVRRGSPPSSSLQLPVNTNGEKECKGRPAPADILFLVRPHSLFSPISCSSDWTY